MKLITWQHLEKQRVKETMVGYKRSRILFKGGVPVLKRYSTLFTKILLFATLVIIFALSACAPEKPQVSPADFYKKEVVTLVCPYAAGGGADLDARLFAARWGEITGGTMVNVNKSAGGGIEGANYIYESKPDGLTLGHGGPSSAMYVPTLSNDKALKADITKVNWFGAFAPAQFVLVVGKHVTANNIDELKQLKGLKFGATAATSSFAQAAAIVADVFNIDMKLVTGFGNPAEINIAAGKKEVDATLMETFAFYLEEKKGFLKPPFLVVDSNKTDWYPNVEPISKIAKLTPDQEKMINLLLLSSGQGKAFFGPPGMPPDQVKFLRDAWNKTMANNAFVKQMKEMRYPVWEKPLTGEEVAKKATAVVELKTSYGALAELVKKYMK